MMLKKYLLFIFSCFCFYGFSQQKVELSNFSEISIVTSGPGEFLYEKFGHTAVRVHDSVLKLDLIYNYGFFDLSGPDFYINFVKGFMKYKLVCYPFHYSLESAKKDKRWVKQQVLNLTLEEKNAIFNFLNHNALPQNASYLYDPFFNNCATKPRDILKEVLSSKLILDDNFTSSKSFRELMNAEIYQNTWGSVGINIALGSKLDKKATSEEYLYLPDYVFEALSKSKIIRNKQEPFVKKSQVLLDFKEKESKSNIINPLLVFSIILLIGGFITFKNYKNNYRTKWLDFSLFFTTGVLGFLILFLWFFTNHSTAPNNFNALWAMPLNIVAAFYLLKKETPKWITKYIQFLLILIGIVPILWLGRIQLFNWSLFPIFMLLVIRYLFLQKTLNS